MIDVDPPESIGINQSVNPGLFAPPSGALLQDLASIANTALGAHAASACRLAGPGHVVVHSNVQSAATRAEFRVRSRP